MDICQVLKDLTDANGVSGVEEPAVAVAQKYLEKYGEVRIDALGNLICEIQGNGNHIMLDAHIDRVGMVVTQITPEGFLRVSACGGVDNRTLCAQEVTILGSKEVFGVITSVPVHLQNDADERKAIKTDEAIIDVGMSYKQASQYISVGDRVVINSEFLYLEGDRMACHAFDDRAGVASILFALDYLKKLGVKRRITVSFSTREETGASGATTSAFSSQADEFIAVDVSFAKTPDSKAEECGILKKGPMIGIAPSLTYSVSKKLKEVAVSKSIPYQFEIMGGKTGTNADSMSISRGGMKSGLVSIPLRYMHTGIEVVSLSDIENTGLLIANYVSDGGETDA